MKRRDISHLKSDQVGELEQRGTNLAFQASIEGSVLLENNGVLPLAPSPVALYGYGARMTMVRGIGSGDIAYRYVVNIEQGIENAGFTVTSKTWLDEFDRQYAQYRADLYEDLERESAATGIDNVHVLYTRPHTLPASQPVTNENIAESATDTAIYVLSRKEGEGRDNSHSRGGYLPSEEEISQLKKLREGYKKLILLLNIGSPIDMQEISAIGPDAVLVIFQGGAEIGNAVGQMLCGKQSPSGKLTSTWAKDYWDYPNSKEFGENDGDIENELYREGIYMGYRYFDTFDVEPLYPFGYGKTYTDFAIEPQGLTRSGSSVTVTAKITNIGDCSGKEVAQLYVSAPVKTLHQPYQKLCAFAKTRLLAPGEAGILHLTFRMEDITSFSVEQAAYLLEAGDYVLRLGNSSRNHHICGTVRLTGDRITRKVRHLFERPIIFEERTSPKRDISDLEFAQRNAAPVVIIEPDDIPAEGIKVYSGDPINYFGGKIDPASVNKGNGENVFLHVPENISLTQVKNREYTLEELIASMDEEELIHLVAGEQRTNPQFKATFISTNVPGAAGETTSYFIENHPEREIPYTILADGPAGLRLIPRIQADADGKILPLDPLLTYEGGDFVEGNGGYMDGYENYYQYVTGLPISTQLASTWNTDLLYQIGHVVGGEMERYDVDLWLAPGLNLHRNPLCGRNFEYFSEDPFVSAAVSIAITNGVQAHPGRGTTIKHFAANNQEAGRISHNSVVSERTMREVYLKGFELTVKYSDPFAIMTSLNCVDGPHGTNNKDLATYVARDEWGYQGVIMTDWHTTTRGATTAGCINAGDDLIMPGSSGDWERLKTALHNLSGTGESFTLGALQKCAMHVLQYILRTERI